MFTAYTGRATHAVYAQSCTGRGLHGAPRYRGAGELLPPLSILTGKEPAVCFCCTFLGVASTGRYPASCSAVLGLSSRLAPRDRMIGSERKQYTTRRAGLSTENEPPPTCRKHLSFSPKYITIGLYGARRSPLPVNPVAGDRIIYEKDQDRLYDGPRLPQ